MVRQFLKLLAAGLAVGLMPGAAHADSPLALQTAPSPMSAGQGWVVWSAPGVRGWSLMGAHAGVTARLPVDDGGSMLDVDVGTDANGAAVATYSRCTVWYRYRDPSDAAGCEARVLGLASGRERAIGISRRPWQSDTTPSMWRGRVVFARRDTRSRGGTRMLMWSPGGKIREFRRPPVGSSVASIDLGERYVASAVNGGIRVDRLRDGVTASLRSGTVVARGSEFCTVPGARSALILGGPVVAGATVLYSSLSAGCEVWSSTVAAVALTSLRQRTAAAPGAIQQIGIDGAGVFGTIGVLPPLAEIRVSCLPTPVPCDVRRIDALTFGRWSRIPGARWR